MKSIARPNKYTIWVMIAAGLCSLYFFQWNIREILIIDARNQNIANKIHSTEAGIWLTNPFSEGKALAS